MTTPGPESGSKPSLSTPASVMSTSSSISTSTTKHSVESLMEYIKKQKVKIKKLEIELEQQKALNSKTSDSISLSESKLNISNQDNITKLDTNSNLKAESKSKSISSKKVYIKRLATILEIMSQKNDGKITGLKSAFGKWIKFTVGILRSKSKLSIELEQKVSKLKILLARTHQAHQKNIEDSNALKKEQLETSEQLRMIKSKEDSELSLLKEMMRASSIESAFQYDMDKKIEEAVTSWISNRDEENTNGNTPDNKENISISGDKASNNNYNKELDDNNKFTITEFESLKANLENCENEKSQLESRLLAIETQLNRKKSDESKALDDIKNQMNEMKQDVAGVENTLKSERSFRQELELELDELIKNRLTIVAENQSLKQIKNSLEELQQKFEETSNTLRKVEGEKMTIALENDSLRKGHQDESNLRSENTRLLSIVQEFTGRTALGKRSNRLSHTHFHSLDNPNASKEDIANLLIEILGGRYLDSKPYSQDSSDMVSVDRLILMNQFALLLHGVKSADDTVDSLLATFCSKMMDSTTKQIEIKKINDDYKEMVEAMDADDMQFEGVKEVAATSNESIPLVGVATCRRFHLIWNISGDYSECTTINILRNEDVISTMSLSSGTPDKNGVYSGMFPIDPGIGLLQVDFQNSARWAAVQLKYKITIAYCEMTEEENQKSEKLKRLYKKTVSNEVSSYPTSLKSLSKNMTENIKQLKKLKKLITIIDSDSIGVLRKKTQSLISDLSSEPVIYSPATTKKKEFNEDNDKNKIVFSAESITIKPSDDLRIRLPQSKNIIHLHWKFKLLNSGDIGFAIGKLKRNSSLSLLTDYIRYKYKDDMIEGNIFLTSSDAEIVVLFDNSYSWINPKQIMYSISFLEYRDDNIMENTVMSESEKSQMLKEMNNKTVDNLKSAITLFSNMMSVNLTEPNNK